MSILPEGEQLRRAVKWISDQCAEAPDVTLQKLVMEACLRFDLSPKDSEVLMHFFEDRGSARSA